VPIGRGGEFIRALDPQSFDVFEKCLLELRGEFRKRNSSFARAADCFVIHIGDVHNAMHLVTTQLEMTLEQIFEDVSAKISDVRAAVNRWAASVDVDVVRCRIPRPEFLELSRVRIKKAECHFYRWSEGVLEQSSGGTAQCITSLLQYSITPLLLLHCCDRHRGDAFAAPNRTKPLVRRRLDADA